YKRILHALEVYYMTGRKYSSFRSNTKKERDFNIIKIGLNINREELHNRINKRVDKMIEVGLVDEARTVYNYKDMNALNTVGYKEIFEYLDGNITIDEAIELIKRNSRRYARKQLSWFNRDSNITWFAPTELDKIITHIDSKITNTTD
ncbi:MAG TPA: tRNA dimethylallyltransferase, partial [Prolixibacteraceae bacterium]|nr:tRNA dimethylallyltransferase [Prolixibacteraceae bacterium]